MITVGPWWGKGGSLCQRRWRGSLPVAAIAGGTDRHGTP